MEESFRVSSLEGQPRRLTKGSEDMAAVGSLVSFDLFYLRPNV
jgi:hypothetical protein